MVWQREFRLFRVAAWVVLLSVLALPAAQADPPVTVDSADPPEAEQETFGLDVTIRGKGFDEGSVATFLVTGTENPGGVTVLNTAFVDRRTLVATIDVAVDAVVGAFDIEVETLGGRRGKGTEKFSVLQEGGSPHDIAISGTLRDDAGDRVVSDGATDPYEDVMPGTGNLVFQQDDSRWFQLLLLDDPETIEHPCDDDASEVCLRNGSTRVAMSYTSGFLALNRLDVGLDCDGSPNEVFPRDMFAGECIRVYLALNFDHPGGRPRVQLKLRCGKHDHEGGDQIRLECLSNLGDGCLAWDARPFLDGGGDEHLTCQLYHLPRRGNEESLELAEYDIAVGMSIERP